MNGWDNIRPADPKVERDVFLFFAGNHCFVPSAPKPVAAPKPLPPKLALSPPPLAPPDNPLVLQLHGVQILGAGETWSIRFNNGQAKLTRNEARLATILLRAAPRHVAESFVIKSLGFPSDIADLAFSGVMVSLGARVAPLGLTLAFGPSGAAMRIPGVGK